MFPGGGGPGGFAADPQIVPAATPFSGGMFQQLGDRTGGGGGTPTTSSGAASAGDDVVRTIFVTGFPTNLNERELHNTVCNLPGYEASQINLKPAGGGSPQGFVLFSSPAHAQNAMQILNDMLFDGESRLRVEMAHKNMFIKDDPTIRRANSRRTPALALAAPAGPAMMPAMPTPMPMAPAGGYSSGGMTPHGHAYGAPVNLASTLAALRPAGHGHMGGPGHMSHAAAAAAAAAHMMAPHGALPVTGFAPVTNKYDNPPCNTLFIGNLGDNVDEGELVQLFSTQPGFKQLKLLRNTRQVSCFVEFMDIPTGAAVHNGLQGALISSSDRGPIRIQYSKNPFGKRSPQATAGSNSFFSSGSNALAALHANQMASMNMVGEFSWPGTFTGLG